MKSTSGEHFVALDHVRAFAAFIVFTWHFTHGAQGYPVPFDFTPALFPLAILDEGHTGVALFMVLSGYLFAKLLNGRRIHVGAFLWNRALRLLPLLFLVIALVGVARYLSGGDLEGYLRDIVRGIVFPTLPNGGWSITAEFHFYLALPLLLHLVRRSPWLPLILVAVAIAVRTGLYFYRGEIQGMAYWTIVGRLDQFAIGMVSFHYSGLLSRYRRCLLMIILAFSAFWWWFDKAGGLFGYMGYPSRSALWIVISPIEGVAYGSFIILYESWLAVRTGLLCSWLGKLGEYSYSIYLLHFFIVFRAADFVHSRIMDISNFYAAICWAIPFFLLMCIPAYLSYRFVESPFLSMRRRYVIQDPLREARISTQAGGAGNP